MDTDDDKEREYLPWIDKPRVTLEKFMEGAEKNGRLFYGDVIHCTPSGHRVVEIQSGPWDGYFLIIPLPLWMALRDKGAIREE